MKKLILLLMMCLLIISCEKKIDYPVYKRAEKKAMYKEAKDNED